MTNDEYSRTPEFTKVCEDASVKPTKRQASKFRNHKGRAFESVRYKQHNVALGRKEN